MLGVMEERVRHLFGMSIETYITTADALSAKVAQAGERLVQCLLSDGKILMAGNGASSANHLHFSNALLNHFEVERPALPVVVLGADAVLGGAFANEHRYQEVFARQIQSIGRSGDVLIISSSSGNADSLLTAVEAANEHGIDIIALTGRDGGVLANHLGPEDIEIRIPSDSAARIRELHLVVLHLLCDLIENSIFSQQLE